jgi:DNA-binding transcriptional LysR family regulator
MIRDGKIGRTMERTQIRYVIALSEELTFTGAARRCGRSQPSVTSAIKKLEDEFGQPLFERKPAVRLTALGCRILPALCRIEQLYAEVFSMVAQAPTGKPPPAPHRPRRTRPLERR